MYIVYGCMCDNSPAKSTVHTLYMTVCVVTSLPKNTVHTPYMPVCVVISLPKKYRAHTVYD